MLRSVAHGLGGKYGPGWPSGLLKLYRSTDGLKPALGSISWDGTPTITADGVAAGNGPDMGSVNRAARKVWSKVPKKADVEGLY